MGLPNQPPRRTNKAAGGGFKLPDVRCGPQTEPLRCGLPSATRPSQGRGGHPRAALDLDRSGTLGNARTGGCFPPISRYLLTITTASLPFYRFGGLEVELEGVAPQF